MRCVEYNVEGNALKIDWVDGGGLEEMLGKIVEAEGPGIYKITGYTTDKLGKLSDIPLQRLGNRIVNSLGGSWSASVIFADGKRFLTLTR